MVANQAEQGRSMALQLDYDLLLNACIRGQYRTGAQGMIAGDNCSFGTPSSMGTAIQGGSADRAVGFQIAGLCQPCTTSPANRCCAHIRMAHQLPASDRFGVRMKLAIAARVLESAGAALTILAGARGGFVLHIPGSSSLPILVLPEDFFPRVNRDRE